MAKSQSVNYTRAKSHWGAIPGTIQIHTVEGLGQSNDPTTVVFKENIPGGFLRCNGQAKKNPLFFLYCWFEFIIWFPLVFVDLLTFVRKTTSR